MINYFNFRALNDKILITNDLGRYYFVSEREFNAIIHDEVDYDSELGKALQENFFIFPEKREKFLTHIKYPLRTAQSHLLHCTALHIFVLTNACNLKCVYCQARTGNESAYGFMDFETAERAVDFALQSPDDYLTFEFQGGEPLVNFNTLRHIVEYTEEHKEGKVIEYSLVSNLILLTDEILEFIKEYHVNVSTSLDGCSAIHNQNRPFINGDPSFEAVITSIKHLQTEGLHPGAIETTTKKGLSYADELIDTYLYYGFNSIFIRPLTPLGYAYKDWKKIGYTPEEFIAFYKKCMDNIININKRGTYFREGHAAIFLTKAFKGTDPNYMELRSPCGGILGQLAYFYNGDIYTCDEGRMLGEMGDYSFRLGNVYENTYDEVVCSGQCKAVMSGSFLQSIPECTDCAYQPYCGSCPVINQALYGDVYPPADNYRCKLYRGMMDVLFNILEKDEEAKQILLSWVL